MRWLILPLFTLSACVAAVWPAFQAALRALQAAGVAQ